MVRGVQRGCIGLAGMTWATAANLRRPRSTVPPPGAPVALWALPCAEVPRAPLAAVRPARRPLLLALLNSSGTRLPTEAPPLCATAVAVAYGSVVGVTIGPRSPRRLFRAPRRARRCLPLPRLAICARRRRRGVAWPVQWGSIGPAGMGQACQAHPFGPRSPRRLSGALRRAGQLARRLPLRLARIRRPRQRAPLIPLAAPPMARRHAEKGVGAERVLPAPRLIAVGTGLLLSAVAALALDEFVRSSRQMPPRAQGSFRAQRTWETGARVTA